MSTQDVTGKLCTRGPKGYMEIPLLQSGITDGTQTELTNLVSSRSIGDTFSSGAVISHARGGYVENYAIGGIQLLNEQGNVAYQFPITQLEKQNAGDIYPVGVNVALNYQLVVTTSASLA